MSQTETRFVTEDAYRWLRTKQDDDIRGEFERQAGLIEKGNQQLRDELSSLSNTFDELIQVKDEVGEIKARLNRMEGHSFNRSRTWPWHSISIIGIYRPKVGFMLPAYFPTTIKDFWDLQFPAQEENFFYLLRFYDIQGHQHWGQINDTRNTDDSSSGESGSQSDSGDSSPQDLSFEDAVRNYPHVAMDELGSRLGLVLEDIRSFFEKAAQHRQKHQQPAIKRPPVAVDGPDGEVVKRPRKSKVSPKYIPIREPVSTRSAKSPSEMLQWDASANDKAHAQLVAKMQAAHSHSTGSSKDSTTDVIPSQELRDLVSGKKRSNKGL
ncbi:hypothetical protein B0J14DRAFT_699314 [Halenospora varia]|nr:hypothetical protein B0J14DRAFT_699314 [Halenospora varia]